MLLLYRWPSDANVKPGVDLTDQALILAQHAHAALSERIRHLAEVEQDLAVLEGRTCTGRVHWRDGNNGHQPKMVILHSIDQPCPIHGLPKPHGRIRHYVGTDPDKQEEAKHAIALEKERQRLAREHSALTRALRDAAWQLERFYRAFGYEIPEDPTEAPQPREDWNPVQEVYGW